MCSPHLRSELILDKLTCFFFFSRNGQRPDHMGDKSKALQGVTLVLVGDWPDAGKQSKLMDAYTKIGAALVMGDESLVALFASAFATSAPSSPSRRSVPPSPKETATSRTAAACGMSTSTTTRR